MENHFEKNLAISDEVARWLLDIKAVNFRPNDPYMFTAGWASPVYIDCRWIISFLQARPSKSAILSLKYNQYTLFFLAQFLYMVITEILNI